jgi:hypothetical protein
VSDALDTLLGGTDDWHTHAQIVISACWDLPSAGEIQFDRGEERIGYYKVWRRDNTMGFRHWQNQGRAVDDARKNVSGYYLIAFEKKTLKPLYFAREGTEVLLSFGRYALSRTFVEPVYGESKKHYTGYLVTS